TSGAATRCRTCTSPSGSSSCAGGTRAPSSTSRTASATTGATRSTAPSCAPSAGPPSATSTRASPPPSRGTARTAGGGSRFGLAPPSADVRILVTGAAGQVGREVTEQLARTPHHEVRAATRAELDLADRDQVLGPITGWRPDLVLHLADMTAVDLYQSEVDQDMPIDDHA